MIGSLMILGWILTGIVVYFYLPNAPLSSTMGVVGKPILRAQYALFAMGWMGKLFAFASYFIAGKWWAIGICIASLIALFSTAVLAAWNWHPKTNSEIIEDMERKLMELKRPYESHS